MSRNGSRPVKKDRSTLFGVFAILSLLPTAFSVSFEYSARGISSGRPWLMALFPMLLLVAARFIPVVWPRWRAVGWLLVGVATVAGGLYCWHMSGLLGFLGVTTGMRFVVPAVIAVMYAAFAITVGHRHARMSVARSGRYTSSTRVVERSESLTH